MSLVLLGSAEPTAMLHLSARLDALFQCYCVFIEKRTSLACAALSASRATLAEGLPQEHAHRDSRSSSR